MWNDEYYDYGDYYDDYSYHKPREIETTSKPIILYQIF
jgi:hypothetical protein